MELKSRSRVASCRGIRPRSRHSRTSSSPSLFDRSVGATVLLPEQISSSPGRVRSASMPAAIPGNNRAVILANPRSRLAGGRDWRDAALGALSTRYASELVEPGSARETTELARAAAADGVAVVIAAGGDGTINAVAQGLAG